MVQGKGRALRSFRAGLLVGSSVLATVAGVGCSAGAPIDGDVDGDGSAESVGTAHDELVVSVSDPAAYKQSCWDNNVPLPPAWGRDNVGTGKNWQSRGRLPYEESYLLFGGSNVYLANPLQKDGKRGVCAIAAHIDEGTGAFDIICQGKGGKACFWEGFQSPDLPVSPAPGSIDLLSANWTSGGKPIIPPNPTFCTNCHSGQNAFITHYAPPKADGSAGNALAAPTTNEISARPGLEAWMPATYGVYDPLGGATDSANMGGANPAKDPFTGYPQSSSGCLTCHNTAIGGGFPLMSTPQIQGGLCNVIYSVTNRPASMGGMPPTWADGTPNNCTPNFDCAQQRDPFVQKLLTSCGISYEPGGTGATPAFARDVHPATPFLFRSSSPLPGGVQFVATTQDSSGSGFLAKWVFKSNLDGWGIPGTTLPSESSTRNFYTSNRPAGYIKSGNKRSFVVTSYAGFNDGFGQVGDVYEQTIDGGAITNVTKGAFKPKGQPAPLYRADGYNSIYVADPDGWIHQFDWDPNTSSWGGNYNLHNYGQVDALKSSPMAFTGLNNSIVVAYACGSRSSCEMRFSFSTWTWTEVVTTSPVNLVAGTRPTAILYNGKQYTFFNTTSGLYMASDSTGTGYSTPTRISVSTNRFFSSPMPYVRGDGSLEVLINYTDSLGGQNLYSYTLTGTSWPVKSLFSYSANGVAPVVGDPVGYISYPSDQTNGALFVDANRSLRFVQQTVAGGPWAFPVSGGHSSASVLFAANAWKKYVTP